MTRSTNQTTEPKTGRLLTLAPTGKDRRAGVFNRAHERIGRVKAVALDRQSGEVDHMILAFGGVLGLGARRQAVPWSKLTYDPDLGGYVVPLTVDLLRLAPKLDVTNFQAWDAIP